MVNYQLGKVYQIVNTKDDEVYVGSTTQSLCKRMAVHRSKSTTGKSKLYRHMREVGNANFSIILLENWPCNAKYELDGREYEYKKRVGTLNTNNPGAIHRAGGKAQYAIDYSADYSKTEKGKEATKRNNTKRLQPIQCECGTMTSKLNMKVHKTSFKHQRLMKELN